MKPRPVEETLSCRNPAEWESWLELHHQTSDGVWILIARKGFEKDGIVIEDALDVALCFGWIDSQRKSHDRTHYLQRYSPRRPKSPWSLRNVKRAEALISTNRMREAGSNEIASAQADGRWAVAYAPQSEAETPPEVLARLALSKRAQKRFEALSKSAQYLLVLPFLKATTPESRKRQLENIIKGFESSENG